MESYREWSVMPEAQVNGITVHYDERGAGEPLLLVMGLGAQMLAWQDGFVDGLVQRGFRVIRFDNRDVGLSTKMSGEVPGTFSLALSNLLRRPIDAPYQLTDMADDAVGLLDHLNIDAAHVVGASMGGMIAQTMAIHHSSRVKSLCSIMSNTGDRKNGGISVKIVPKLRAVSETTRENAVDQGVELARLISGRRFDPVEARAQGEILVERSYYPEGTDRQLAAINAGPDRTAGLAKLTMPTLVIHGLEDPLVKHSGGIATANAVPGSRLLMFPDMGHDMPRNRWVEMVDGIAANAARATAPLPNTVAPEPDLQISS